MTDYADLEKRLREFGDEMEEHARSAIDHPYDGTDQTYHDSCMLQATMAREAADALASLTIDNEAMKANPLHKVGSDGVEWVWTRSGELRDTREQVASLTRELEEAKEALKPFAEASACLDHTLSRDTSIFLGAPDGRFYKPEWVT